MFLALTLLLTLLEISLSKPRPRLNRQADDSYLAGDDSDIWDDCDDKIYACDSYQLDSKEPALP